MSSIRTMVVAAVALSALGGSCGKKENCSAGTGGAATLTAYGKHHGKIVTPKSVHVKFNSLEFPGSDAASYDLTIAADTTEDHIEIENLKCGDYYIYMIGYDTALKETVKGGIPYTVEENASGEINLNVPITE